MEPSVAFEADALRNEKAKVLQAIRRPDVAVAGMAVRGQYEGYRNEEGVEGASRTATYAAVELYVDNWRWQGVPFFLRSGKGLSALRGPLDPEPRWPLDLAVRALRDLPRNASGLHR